MQFLKRIILHFHRDSLYRNSIYLMLSTFSMAFFGFFFWILCARLYTTEQIGLATTLISITTFIITFSQLGFGTTLIRYLPQSNIKNEMINTAFTITSLSAAVVAIVYLFGLQWFSPKLLFIQRESTLSAIFVVIIMIGAVSAMSDNIFIAYRSTKYIFIYNTLFSLVKLSLPIVLVSFGMLGIYFSVSVGTLSAVLLTFIFLTLFFSYRFYPSVNITFVRQTAAYSLQNYFAGLIGTLSTYLLPIIITNRLGPQSSAYYYMAFMIMNLIYIIPMSASRSLFAEGSSDDKQIIKFIQKTLKIIFLILTPAVLLTVSFGKYILLVFGKEFSMEGNHLLQLLTISTFFYTFNTIGGAVLNIKKRVTMLILVGVMSTTIQLSLIYLLLPYGLTGVGMAWILGQFFANIIYIILILITWRKRIKTLFV